MMTAARRGAAGALVAAAVALACGESQPSSARPSDPLPTTGGSNPESGAGVANLPGGGKSDATGGGGGGGGGGAPGAPAGAPAGGGLGPSAMAGNPVAIVKGRGTPEYGGYYAEILRAEGISSFDVLELGDLSSLSRYQLVVLAETPLSDAQAELLTDWVGAGGRLLSNRPDPHLSELLGIGPAKGTLAEGYLQVSRARWGVTDSALQFHGVADLHDALPGTSVEGKLLRASRADAGAPALTLRRNIGPGGGQAAAVMFDLARSVIFTRQGNPEKAGKPPVLDPVPRAAELFNGYLDARNFSIAQADEQQRLLVAVLQDMNAEGTPVPRFWYLPGGRKLAVVLTGDDHNANGTAAFFDTLQAPPYSPAGCTIADWGCARATSWLYSSVSALKNGGAQGFVSRGFELGPHVALSRDGGCANWTSRADLLERFSARLGEFQADYGITPAPTGRTHCFVFSDWDTQPQVEAEVGIRLDENYTPYLLPGTRNKLGRLNGSALPMRFTDKTGAAIDVYQLVSDMDYEYFDANITGDQMGQAIGALFDTALGAEEFSGFVGTHFDYSGGQEGAFRAALLKEILSRRAQGVAMISARQLLDWLDLRNGSSFDDLRFDGKKLSFTLRIKETLPNPGLEAMVPSSVAHKSLVMITHEGRVVPLKRTLEVRSVSYAFFDAQAGPYQVEYQ